jgi:large subunit ribosomal protein L4
MMDVPIYDRQGGVAETVQFDESCLGRAVHKTLLHQALVCHLANQRVGTHSAKTRSEVMGTTRKPWRQKGLGRARVGTRRNPIWRGGGVVHPPKPREYRQRLSKRARRVALKSALLGKLRDGEIRVLADLEMAEPKTKEAARILKALDVPRGTLVVVKDYDANAWKSVRNLPDVEMTSLSELNAYQALRWKNVVMTKDAFLALPEEMK